MSQTNHAREAAERMDWQQVAFNGGPSCFHLKDGRFCGRAKRWFGHEPGHGGHSYVSLAEMVQAAIDASAAEHVAEIKDLTIRAQEAEARTAELEAALKPFAEACENPHRSGVNAKSESYALILVSKENGGRAVEVMKKGKV